MIPDFHEHLKFSVDVKFSKSSRKSGVALEFTYIIATNRDFGIAFVKYCFRFDYNYAFPSNGWLV